MKWSEIKKQYPHKFILIGDIVEEQISDSQSKIIDAEVLEIRDTGKDIMQAYRHYKQQGVEVLYALPTTPEEFIVRNVPSLPDYSELTENFLQKSSCLKYSIIG